MRRSWIAGTLELNSKVRYGLTSRGVPLYRFVPYDKRFKPMAVGCSQRNLFYNIHAIVEPTDYVPKTSLELPRACLVENLGKPCLESFEAILKQTYVNDNQKPAAAAAPFPPPPSTLPRTQLQGKTFHIDPPGCRDVDDSFTVISLAPNTWRVAINIADVFSTILPDSEEAIAAREKATSFYTPGGKVVQAMFPPWVSEGLCSLLPGSPKNTLSLLFDFSSNGIQNLEWKLTQTTTTTSYTYEEADKAVPTCEELQVIQKIAMILGGCASSHDWVAQLMIFYNKEAAKLLTKHQVGILRRHAESKQGVISELLANAGVPESIVFEAAEYCLPTDENTFHFGLAAEKYAYATSPLRRYADYVNQIALITILLGDTPQACPPELPAQLNRREKQAKAFQRDLFYMTSLTQTTEDGVKGIVIEMNETKGKTKIWVPTWKTTISAKGTKPLPPATPVLIQWYGNPDEARWKEKIVFRVEKLDDS